jgi:hypothetical protein
MYITLWSKYPLENHFEAQGVDWMIILKLMLKKYGVRKWAGFISFRVEFSGELL